MVGRQSPLVGRAAERATLLGALDELDDGGAVLLALSGDAGVGKTALLQELEAAAAERGCRVFAGRCAEGEAAGPFGPLVAALDGHLAALQAADDELIADMGVELSAVFPALTDGAVAAAVPSTAFERHRLHRAIGALLSVLATREPVVLVVDDVHWADPGTVELLDHLVRKLPAGPVLLVLAQRTGQASQALLAALAGIVDRGTIVEVGPLDPVAATELATRLGAADAASLAGASGGNPLFLEQLARGLDEPTVLDAVRAELTGLDGAAAALLRGAAVAGDPCDVDQAAAAAALPEAAALAAVDTLLEHGVVTTTADPRRFGFRHPLVRSAVRDALSDEEQRGAHAAIAAFLAQRGAAVTVQAPHVARAARPGDGVAVAVLAQAAGTVLARAPATAAEWLSRALELLDPAVPRFGFLVPLALAQTASGDPERGRATLDEAIATLDEHDGGRPALVAIAAQLDHLTGRHDHARVRLMAELGRLTDRESPAAFAVALQLGACGLYGGDFADGARWAAEAVRLAQVTDADAAARSTAAALDALMHIELGAGAAALPALDAAAASIDRTSDADLRHRADAFNYIGWAEHWAERHTDAIRHFTRGVDLSRASGQVVLLVPILMGRSFANQAAGRLDAARADVADAEAIARLTGARQFTAWAAVAEGALATLHGDDERAVALCQRGYSESAGEEVRILRAGAAWAYATALVEAGRHQHVEHVLLEGGGGPQLPVMEPGVRVECLVLLARVALARGDADGARAAAGRARTAADDLGLPGASATVTALDAEVLLAAGDAAGAAARAHAAAEAAAGVGRPIASARARALCGRALAAAGDTAAAIPELERAHGELMACGADGFAARVAAELRRAGGHVPGAGGATRLNARQREIANLVVAGLSNRQIAEQLHLSERTVEGHLHRAFDAVGVRSRSALAAVVALDDAA